MTKHGKPARSPLLIGRMMQKIAPRIGAKVIIEPYWKIVGQIKFKNGRKCYFRYSSVDLNSLGASEISKDKDWANFFMKQMGYPTIEGRTFFSRTFSKDFGPARNIDAAYHYADDLGFPVFVKPNSGSQGVGVAKVYTKREFYQALRFIFARDRVAIVQRAMEGKDYRIVVLDKRVISAYERIPLCVVGDGKSTILSLIKKKQKEFVKRGRDTVIKFQDPKLIRKLARQHLSLKSVVAKDQKIFLLDNANLSSGGDAIDVTDVMHLGFKKIAVQLTKDMGLRICGVDILIEGDITKKPGVYHVLETNSAPGLDHYFLSGKKQEKIVEDLYLEVLKAME